MRGAGTLARWCSHFIDRTFKTMQSLYTGASPEKVGLSMHDPACIWYLLNKSIPTTSSTTSSSSFSASSPRAGAVGDGDGEGMAPGWARTRGQDIRMECQGRWSRGACIVDNRGRQRLGEAEVQTHGGDPSPPSTSTSTSHSVSQADSSSGDGGVVADPTAVKRSAGTVVSRRRLGDDHDSWLRQGQGNSIDYVSATPGGAAFVEDFMPLVFGRPSHASSFRPRGGWGSTSA